MKPIKHIVVFAIGVVLSGLLLGFAMSRSNDSLCTELRVEVLGDPGIRFVTQEGVQAFIHEHGHTVQGQFMNDVNTYGIEEDILTIPFVKEALVYKTIDHEVVVAVHQRVPVMRLFFEDGRSCYVDEEGAFLQLSDKFSYKCLSVTGLGNGSVVTDSTTVHGHSELLELWKMAHYVQADEFWSAQIIQVDMDKKDGAVIIPRVGNHQIIMGDVVDHKEKLVKLKEFYDKGIDQTNWNIYHCLDLRYEGQVVGVKR